MPRFIDHGGERRVGARRDRGESRRQRLDAIAVAHPHAEHGAATGVGAIGQVSDAPRLPRATRPLIVGRSETLDPVDVAGHRHDVCGVPDELHRGGAIQDELLTATVHDWCQLAITPHDDQPPCVWQGSRAFTDTVPLTLSESVEPASWCPLDIDEHARPAGPLVRLQSRTPG